MITKLERGGGVKALVVGPLVKELFSAASLTGKMSARTTLRQIRRRIFSIKGKLKQSLKVLIITVSPTANVHIKDPGGFSLCA